MLNFRDNFFPYLGLILFMVMIVGIAVLCALVHTKKVLFWALGNAAGFGIGWLISTFAGYKIIEAFGLNVSVDFISGGNDIAKMIAEVASPIIILIIVIAWNIIVLIPVYFFLYKKMIGIYDIDKYTDKINSKYFHHKKGLLISEKIAGIVLSFVAFYPVVSTTSANVNSLLCSKKNLDDNSRAKKVDHDLGFLCGWSHPDRLRDTIDAAQGMINFVKTDLEVNLYSPGSDSIYYNYIESIGSLVYYKDSASYFSTSQIARNFFSPTGDTNYKPNYIKLFSNSTFVKYGSYLFESKKMINVFMDSLHEFLKQSTKADSESFNNSTVERFLRGESVSTVDGAFEMSSNPANAISISSHNFDYFADKLSEEIFTDPYTIGAFNCSKDICNSFFSIN